MNKHSARSIARHSLLALTVAAAGTSALAAEGEWYINPMVGYQWFDSDRNLDDEALLGLGLEYHFSDRWGAEIKYLDSSVDTENGNGEADLGQLMLEGMYFLGASEKLQPYLAAGIGHAEFDYDNFGEQQETQFTAGAGMRYWFSERWSAKADFRFLHGHDDSTNDQLITLGISYVFGKTSAPKPAPEPAPVAAAAVAPQPVDSDGDGVYDDMDQCPNTPSTAAVDSKGCAKKLDHTESIALNVKFASGKAEVTAAYMDEIVKVAEFMKQYPTVSGTIEGHTDNTGSAAFNKTLSQHRADAVRQVLIDSYGIDASRLTAVGYGEDKPIADNATADGRQLNRRVVAVFAAEVTKIQQR